jgi:hypothetical protein
MILLMVSPDYGGSTGSRGWANPLGRALDRTERFRLLTRAQVHSVKRLADFFVDTLVSPEFPLTGP